MDNFRKKLLDEKYQKGWLDAGEGVFNSPYPNSDNPDDETFKEAYEAGFRERREELGDDFKWDKHFLESQEI